MNTLTQLAPGRLYVTVAEAAIAFAVSDMAIRNWIRKGKIEAVKVGRSIRIPVSQLDPSNWPAANGNDGKAA